MKFKVSCTLSSNCTYILKIEYLFKIKFCPFHDTPAFSRQWRELRNWNTSDMILICMKYPWTASFWLSLGFVSLHPRPPPPPVIEWFVNLKTLSEWYRHMRAYSYLNIIKFCLGMMNLIKVLFNWKPTDDQLYFWPNIKTNVLEHFV